MSLTITGNAGCYKMAGHGMPVSETGALAAADTIQVTKQTLDHVELKLDRISKIEPFHVQLFDVADADLGKPKHRDTARRDCYRILSSGPD